jgi:hypothetical protein
MGNDAEELVFISSEDIISSIDKYINAYPDPYTDLDTVLSFILEECICSAIDKHSVEPDLMIIADDINSKMIEFANAILSDAEIHTGVYGTCGDMDISNEVFLKNLEDNCEKIMSDGKLKDYLLDMIKAIYEEVNHLHLPKSKANVLEYVSKVTYNGMGILSHFVNDIN